MKPLLCSALVLLTFSLNAQAPVPLAHGDVPGEPHHHLKIENEYVRAYYVEVPPHEDTLLHQHDHDYLFVTLGATEVINAVLGKPEVKLALKDGEVRFTRGGFAHVARNLGDKPFRNVTIELLKPQGEPYNLCEKVIPGPLNDCPPSHADMHTIDWSYKEVPGKFGMRGLFQTERTYLTSISVVSEIGPAADYFPQPPRLLVALEGSKLKLEFPDKSATILRAGDLFWLPAGFESMKMTNLLERGASHSLVFIFWDNKLAR
jgi:quercetin dioxygenase-like cupin family protein